MQDDEIEVFCDNVRCLLQEIRQIRQDTGYSTDQVLLAMLVEAVREIIVTGYDDDDMI